MKRMFLISGAMLLAACTQTQQAQPAPLADTPEATAEAAENTTEEQEVTADNEQAEPTKEEKKHVCSDLMSCKLGLCPNGRKNKEAAKKAEDTSDGAKENPVLPSEEQIAAAHKIMQKQAPKAGKPAKRPARVVVTEPEPILVDEPAPVVTVNNTSGIPGRSGLRMGRFAPPEEAVSSQDAAAPQPNAAERHGLRSPKLPDSLPMDIDGKTTN